MIMDVAMLMYLVLVEQISYTAAAADNDYCGCCEESTKTCYCQFTFTDIAAVSM